MLSATEPSAEEVVRQAAKLTDDRWARASAYTALSKEILLTAGVSEHAAGLISLATHFPIEPEEVVAMVRGIPFPSGLIAMRFDYTSLGDSYAIKMDNIAVGGYTFAVPERWLEPVGSDQEIVRTVAKGDMDALAGMLTAAIQKSIRSADTFAQSELLERIGGKLVAIAARNQAAGAG